MVLAGTTLQVIDNSGARFVKCLKILGGSDVGYVGDTLIVSVQKINPLKKIKKGDVLRAILISVKKGQIRKNGFCVSFDINGAVIVNNKNIPIGTRILGPVMLELRTKGFLKILSLALVAV